MNSPGSLRPAHLRHKLPAIEALILAKEKDAVRRRRSLTRVERELSKGNYKRALAMVKQLQGKPGGLRGFGAAKQVHRRISSLDELKLSGMGISSFQSLVDSALNSIESSNGLQFVDGVSDLELVSLMHSQSYESLYEEHRMCMQHEAGHFLVGYLLGVLPKRYEVATLEALSQQKFAGGAIQFMGFEFLHEVDTLEISRNNFSRRKLSDGIKANNGKLSSTILNRFLCVMLGGLAAEYLVFGYCDGHHSDVEKMKGVLEWLGFTESEADSLVKWAAVNTLTILVRHQEARSSLAEAMSLGKSVGCCIEVIEDTLSDSEI